MATFSDDFNRANSTDLGTDWVEWGEGAAIYGSGIAIATDFGGAACNKVTTADHYAEITIRDVAGGGYFTLFVRGNQATAPNGTGGSCYKVFGNYNGGEMYISKRVSGTRTQLSTTYTTTPNSGDVWRLSVVGSTITWTINGTTVREVTDTDITSGTWTGFGCAGWSPNTVRFDDWACVDLGAEAVPPPSRPVVVSPRQVPTIRRSAWVVGPARGTWPGTASGSLDLAGTVAVQAAATATGSLSLAGASAAAAWATATGSLALSGAAASAGVATASGAVTLGGTAAAVAAATIVGSLTLGGTAEAGAVPAAALPLVVTRRGPTAAQHLALPFVWVGAGVVEDVAAVTASGSLTLGGTASAAGAATASGSLALGGTATSAAPVSATGSLTLGGAATAAAPASASGSLSLEGAVSAAAPATASGSLDLGGTAQTGTIALGGLTLSGAAAAVASTTAAGSLTLDGAAAAAVAATAAGSLTIAGVGEAAGVTVAIGTLTLDGWAALSAQAAAAGLLTLGAVMRTGPQRGRAHAHVPARPTAGHYQPA